MVMPLQVVVVVVVRGVHACWQWRVIRDSRYGTAVLQWVIVNCSSPHCQHHKTQTKYKLCTCELSSCTAWQMCLLLRCLQCCSKGQRCSTDSCCIAGQAGKNCLQLVLLLSDCMLKNVCQWCGADGWYTAAVLLLM